MRYLLLCSYQCIKSGVIADRREYSSLFEIKKVSLFADSKRLRELQTVVKEEIDRIESSSCLTLSSPYLMRVAVFKIPGSCANDPQTAFNDLGAYVKQCDVRGQDVYQTIESLSIVHAGYINDDIGQKEYSLQEMVKAEFDEFLYEWLEG